MLKNLTFKVQFQRFLKGEVANKYDPAVDRELRAADFLIIYIGGQD